MISTVRLSRLLPFVAAAAGALSVGAALFSARQASLQFGVVMLVALTGYVTAEAAPPRGQGQLQFWHIGVSH